MIKKLFPLFISVLVCYLLFLIVVPYYHYYAFKSDLREILRVSEADRPEEVMARILNLVEQYNIPIKEKDIKLKRKKQYVVTVSWQETVDFFTIYQKTFEFYIDTSKPR